MTLYISWVLFLFLVFIYIPFTFIGLFVIFGKINKKFRVFFIMIILSPLYTFSTILFVSEPYQGDTPHHIILYFVPMLIILYRLLSINDSKNRIKIIACIILSYAIILGDVTWYGWEAYENCYKENFRPKRGWFDTLVASNVSIGGCR